MSQPPSSPATTVSAAEALPPSPTTGAQWWAKCASETESQSLTTLPLKPQAPRIMSFRITPSRQAGVLLYGCGPPLTAIEL